MRGRRRSRRTPRTAARWPVKPTSSIKPGTGRGLLDVYGDRFLLKLLVRKEIKVRYRGSVLGLLWSYVKPLVQFLIYFVALGIFLNLQRGRPTTRSTCSRASCW